MQMFLSTFQLSNQRPRMLRMCPLLSPMTPPIGRGLTRIGVREVLEKRRALLAFLLVGLAPTASILSSFGTGEGLVGQLVWLLSKAWMLWPAAVVAFERWTENHGRGRRFETVAMAQRPPSGSSLLSSWCWHGCLSASLALTVKHFGRRSNPLA